MTKNRAHRSWFPAVVASACALAWCVDARALPFFVSYGDGDTNTAAVSTTSGAIDLGEQTSFLVVSATLGLTVSSLTAATLSTGDEGLQVLQGCPLAAASCTAGDWTDITGVGTSLGGTSFTQTILPTQTVSFSTGDVTITGISVESLRLRFDAAISPPASLGVSGTLAVLAVPEPSTLGLLLAGGALGVGIARRRRS